MDDLELLVIIDPPAEPDALDTAPIDRAIESALKEPPALETSFARGETLSINLPVADASVQLEVHPLAIEGLVIDRYCAGGWSAVTELRVAISDGLGALNVFSEPREDVVNRSIRHAVFFSRKLADGLAFLEQLVAEALVRIAADALEVGTNRIEALRPYIENQRTRYGITAVEAVEGGEGHSGGENVFTDNPAVEVRGSTDQANALAEAVRQVIRAHRALVETRKAERWDSAPGREATGEAAPGRDRASRSSDEERREAQARIAAAERLYVETCGRIAMKPDGHEIAPAVFALARGKEESLPGDVPSDRIWSKAYLYLREATRLADTALPKAGEYPFVGLRERMAIPIGALGLGLALPGDATDSPELRCALWASERLRGYSYEPLDDEAILVALHKDHASRFTSAGDGVDAIDVVFRYRVLTELIMARDTRDRMLADRAQAERAPVERVGRLSGILGLIGLYFPPAEVASVLLGLYVAAGSALMAIGEVDAANREITAAATSALINSDSARAAYLIAQRPSVTGIIGGLIVELAAFDAIGRLSRPAGLALQVFFDVEAAVAPSDEAAAPRPEN